MGTATINLSAVIDTIGGTANAPIRLTAQVMRGGRPAIRVAGALATVPAPLTAYWNGNSWTVPPALTDVAGDCYWRIELTKTDGSARLVRTVVLPSDHGAAIDFGALTDIDPKTLLPYVPAPSVQDLVDTASAILAQVQAGVGTLAIDGGAPDSTYIGTIDIDGGAP